MDKANRGGRPPYYETPEALQQACEDFFAHCDATETPYTVTGLALALGFSSRQSLDDTAKREGFSDVVKGAKLRVENGYEMRLFADKPTGAIFALKNMGWEDKQQRTVDARIEGLGSAIADAVKKVRAGAEEQHDG